MGQTLYPTAIVAKGGLGGLVTDIDDDPASPDGNWCTSGSASTYFGSGNGTVAALTGSGAGPMTGTTYWLHDPANGTVATVPSGLDMNLLTGSSLVYVDGRDAVKISITDSQSDQGLDSIYGTDTIGPVFNTTKYFRWWLKFDANYAPGTTGERKWKIGRLGNAVTGMVTFYWYLSGWEMGELYDGFSDYELFYASNNDPTSDTTLRNWNEFILELVYPPNSGDMSNTYFRIYRNGSLLGTSNARQWFTSSSDQFTQWGGMMTKVFPQLNSVGTGGGDIYIGETSITDFFYSTY